MASNLISSTEYYDRMGIAPGDVEAADQLRIDRAIGAASAAVRSHTDRDFTLASEAAIGPQLIRYDESGIVDIPDATSVTSVSVATTPWTISRTLDATEWIAGPYNSLLPIKTYLEIWGRFLPASPAMGFNRNLDNPMFPVRYGPVILSVDAVWGWEEIPEDVKQAMIWTIEAMKADPSPFVSESIEGYARTRRWSTPIAVPDRAQAALDPYTRLNV